MKRLPEKTVAELAALDATAEEDVDTSDIPERTDWTGAERGRFYRPIKRRVTLWLDADVIEAFKAEGPGYQTRINAALRAHAPRRRRGAA